MPGQTADGDLSYLSATEQLRLFRQGELEPLEVLEAQIARAEELGAIANAITEEHFDAARDAARASAGRYARGEALALDGVTVGIKEGHGLAGWRSTMGSRSLAGERLTSNSLLADLLLGAGAVMPFQTSVPEFLLAPVTWSEQWGVTRNPWNPAYSAGGSSGGSAAALATGMCTLATGSDLGGSIRIPAALCGLYGFKPPYGRVPARGLLTHIATGGPMARTLGDVALMQGVLAGPHRDSPATLPDAPDLCAAQGDVRGMRLALSVDQGWARVESATAANVRAAGDVLRGEGAMVEEIPLELPVPPEDIGDALAEAALAGPMGAFLAGIDTDAELTSYGREFVERARRSFDSSEADRFQKQVQAINRAFHEQVFGAGYDALLTPTLATSHIPAEHDHTRDRLEIDGEPVHPIFGWLMTPVFNMVNWYPVLSVPTGLTGEGVPTGMQIAARSYDDATVFRVGAAHERAAEALFPAGGAPRLAVGQIPS